MYEIKCVISFRHQSASNRWDLELNSPIQLQSNSLLHDAIITYKQNTKFSVNTLANSPGCYSLCRLKKRSMSEFYVHDISLHIVSCIKYLHFFGFMYTMTMSSSNNENRERHNKIYMYTHLLQFYWDYYCNLNSSSWRLSSVYEWRIYAGYVYETKTTQKNKPSRSLIICNVIWIEIQKFFISFPLREYVYREHRIIISLIDESFISRVCWVDVGRWIVIDN
jgi:hypothetical protein